MFHRKTSVFKNQKRFGALCFKFESNNRIYARIPIPYTPGLDDTLIRQQLHVASSDHPAET